MNVIFKNNCGQTLVEVLITLGIAGLVISAMTIAITTSLSNATFGKNQSMAAQYAQDGIEIVQQMQNGNYATFTTLSGRYCLPQTCSTITTSGSCGPNSSGNNTNCNVNINNIFIRQVDVLPIGSAQSKCINSIQATVSVLWTDGKCQTGTYCHQSQLVSCFSNANVPPIP